MDPETQKEMDALAGIAPAEEENPPVDEKVEASGDEGTPEKEEKVETEVVTPEPEKPAKEEPSPADTLAAENERLRQELNELARRTGAQPKKEEPAVLPPKEESLSEVQFLTEEEAESVLDDPKLFNKILNKVFQAGREITLREMPTLVRQQALMEMTIQQKIQGFWSENKDLAPYKDFCSMVASQLETENPGLAFDEVLAKTGEVARERLKLPPKGTEAPEVVAEEKPSEKPALPSGPRGARRPAATPQPNDSQQKEMEDLAKAFGL